MFKTLSFLETFLSEQRLKNAEHHKYVALFFCHCKGLVFIVKALLRAMSASDTLPLYHPSKYPIQT